MLSAGDTLPYDALFVASDHAGVDMKAHLIGRFPFLPWQDLGTHSTAAVDYPDYAQKLCRELEPKLPRALGILICGSGIGVAVAANRFPFVRAALCWNETLATLSRSHNDANVLCLASRHTSPEEAERMLTAFLRTPFEEGRHRPRVDKLSGGC